MPCKLLRMRIMMLFSLPAERSERHSSTSLIVIIIAVVCCSPFFCCCLRFVSLLCVGSVFIGSYAIFILVDSKISSVQNVTSMAIFFIHSKACDKDVVACYLWNVYRVICTNHRVLDDKFFSLFRLSLYFIILIFF